MVQVYVCSPEHAEAQGGGEVCLWKVVRGRKGTGGWEAVCLSVILYLSQGKALGSVTMSERVPLSVAFWGKAKTYGQSSLGGRVHSLSKSIVFQQELCNHRVSCC